jgi:hypothetical protein
MKEEKKITREDIILYVTQNTDDIALMDFLNSFTFPYTAKFQLFKNSKDNREKE